MNYLRILMPLMTLMLLVACTVAGEEPVPEPETPTASPALKVITPANPTQPADPAAEQQPEVTIAAVPPEPTAEDEAPAGTEVESSSASPAEVDLSQVTSQPPAEASPQVAPRPGVPDPEVAAAHLVSQDLAKRLGVDVEDVKTISIESVEWSDSSMGCPAPERVYLGVVTPGYLITLEVSGERYTYHTDLEENRVLCAEDGRPLSD